MEYKFIHRISKGSRFNQIYIPKEMGKVFEVGDLVRVELIEKKEQVFFWNVHANEFKKKIIGELLSYISKLNVKEIKQAFIVGSFLKDADYRDIDILLVSESKTEEEVYEKLTEKFGLKFHVISIPDERFKTLIEICPLTRNMLFSYASNKKFKLPEKKIDKEHINFLLMMPEDLLKIKAGGRVFYDIIRRLVTIENFLEKENPEKINSELKKILGNLFDILRKDDKINEEIIKKLRKIIKSKLNIIKKKIRNVKK